MDFQFFKDSCLQSILDKNLLNGGNINSDLFFNTEPGIHEWLASLNCDSTLIFEFDEKTNIFTVFLHAPIGDTSAKLSVYEVASKQFSLQEFVKGLFAAIEETNTLRDTTLQA
jgi:hypothetical protein